MIMLKNIILRVILDSVQVFKSALRFAKRAGENERADAFAVDLCNKKCDEFWRGVQIESINICSFTILQAMKIYPSTGKHIFIQF